MTKEELLKALDDISEWRIVNRDYQELIVPHRMVERLIRNEYPESTDAGHTCAPMPKRSNPYTGEEPVNHMTIKQHLSAAVLNSLAGLLEGPYLKYSHEDAVEKACSLAECMMEEWKRRGWA